MQPIQSTVPEPTQEVRFAVVLYGGVSLAIYINGVAQELLRMVRSTASLPPSAELTGTEKVYREIGRLLHHGRKPGEKLDPKAAVRTRFVVDILSGSSAGGINGVYLAKAMALKAKDLNLLRGMWMDDADMDTLLNDEKSDYQRYPSGAHKTSLLNSERMYGLLYKALEGMNEPGLNDSAAGAFADQIDLFITATDLNGLRSPLQLSDRQVVERKHQIVFHFAYEDPHLYPRTEGVPDPKNQFEAKYDPMLAFAARCTSSFPVAFEPMTFEKIGRELEKRNLKLSEVTEQCREFFPDYTQRESKFDKRPLADGGYLDNKPFSHAIRHVEHRTSSRPVQRKLLYVDPFPEYSSDYTVKERIDFLSNAQLAAMGLPRYETIRQDLETVHEGNRRQRRLKAWRERIEADYRAHYPNQSSKPTWRSLGRRFEELDLTDMVGAYDIWYAQYHHIRVYDVTDAIAGLFTRVAGFNQDSDECYAVRLLAKEWRDAHYAPYRTAGKETENRFLLQYDIDFRLRLLQHLRAWIEPQLISQPDDALVSKMRSALSFFSTQVRHLLRRRELLESPLGTPPAIRCRRCSASPAD